VALRKNLDALSRRYYSASRLQRFSERALLSNSGSTDKPPNIIMHIKLLVPCLTFAFVFLLAPSIFAQTSPCANGDESGLPLPSGFLPARLPEFQAQLKSFLTSAKYKTLKWCEDKEQLWCSPDRQDLLLA
jgi:hypothetical protein